MAVRKYIPTSSSQSKVNGMKIKAVMFDLDGTLLPMDQDVFIKAYFGGLVKKLVPLGYDAEQRCFASFEICITIYYRNCTCYHSVQFSAVSAVPSS